MPVGFSDPPPFELSDDDEPEEPWALRFSRFEALNSVAIGALAFSHSDGVSGLGGGITIAHKDTGFTSHPELMHGGNVRVNDARTFTMPAPSFQTFGPGIRQFLNNTTAGGSVSINVSYTIQNGFQVQAGVSVVRVFGPSGCVN